MTITFIALRFSTLITSVELFPDDLEWSIKDQSKILYKKQCLNGKCFKKAMSQSDISRKNRSSSGQIGV